MNTKLLRNSMINNSIKLIFGIIIIIFILWNRIIRERIPINIGEIFLNKTIILTIIILIIISLIISIKKLKKDISINGSSTYLKYILQMSLIIKLQEYLNSPKYLHETLSHKFSFQPLIEKPFSYLTVYYFYPRTLKTIFVFLFIIDVIYYQKFNLSYYFMFLPLIPMIFHSYLYIAEDFSKKYIHYLVNHLVFKKSNDNEFEVSPIDFEPNIPDALSVFEIKEKFNVILDHWEIYTTILNYIKSLNNSCNRIENFITIFILTIYLIGWSYILYKNFYMGQ